MTDPTGVGGFNLSQEWTTQTAPVLGVQFKEISFRWATVTVSSPLQIQLDGDGLVLPLVPDSLIEAGGPPVGARLWVQLFGRRVIVLGVAGGLIPGSLTTLIASVASLGTTVSTHTSQIATNTADIATAIFVGNANSFSIGVNGGNITTLQGQVSTLQGQMSSAQSTISSHTSTLSSHTSTLSSHTSSISSLNSSVSSINGQLADLPTEVKAGTVTVAVSSSVTGTQHVTFPGGSFSSIPAITLTQAANSRLWLASIDNATTSGFDATVGRPDNIVTASASIGCHWIAVQM